MSNAELVAELKRLNDIEKSRDLSLIELNRKYEIEAILDNRI